MPELAQEPLPLARPRREHWSRPVCVAPARLALGSPPSQDAASRGDAGASSPRPSSQLASWFHSRAGGRDVVRSSTGAQHWERSRGEQVPGSPPIASPRALGQQTEAFAAAGAEQSLSPGCKIQQPSTGSASRDKLLHQGPDKLLPEQWVSSNS